MSARDPRSFVASVMVQAGYSHSTAETVVQRALDAHAHELAEQIRAVGVDGWEGMSDTARLIREARAAVADLIDPEVAE